MRAWPVSTRVLVIGALLALLSSCSNSSQKDKTIAQLQATIAAQQQRAAASPTAQPLANATATASPSAASRKVEQSPTPAQSPSHVVPATPVRTATPAPPPRDQVTATSIRAAAAAASVPAPFTIGAFQYQVNQARSSNASIGAARLYFQNNTSGSLPARVLDIKQIVVDSADGQHYFANYKVLHTTDVRSSYPRSLLDMFETDFANTSFNIEDFGKNDVVLAHENTFDAYQSHNALTARIPVAFPFRNVDDDIEDNVVVAWKMSNDAKPTQLHILEHDGKTYDARLVENLDRMPAVNESLLQIRPSLANRTAQTADATLTFSGRCSMVDNQFALAFTATNKSATNAVDGTFSLPFAAYFPDGVVAFDSGGLTYSLDAGAKEDSSDGIDRVITADVPAPTLITFFDPAGDDATYRLNCTK